MSDNARLWSDSIPKVWFQKIFFNRLKAGKMKESITQVGGQNSAHTSELVRRICDSYLINFLVFHVDTFVLFLSVISAQWNQPHQPLHYIEKIIVDWIWGAGGLQSKTWTKSTLHNSGRFFKFPNWETFAIWNSQDIMLTSQLWNKQCNDKFCQKVEEDSVVVTGGGASPNGVKAFVTQYSVSGLQEGQVDKRCEKLYLSLIWPSWRWLFLSCIVWQNW